MITQRSAKSMQVAEIKPVISRAVESATLYYKEHPLIGQRFGPNLAVQSVQIDREDKFGLDIMHRVRFEHRDKGGIYVNFLGAACAAVKTVYGNIHIKAIVRHRELTLEFYARPIQQEQEKPV
jgi:hypothetical protein